MPANSLLSRYSADYGSLVSRRNSERSLRAAAIDAALANRAKSDFLANVSHELRTPLNAIIGFSDLICTMNKEGKPAKTVEYAQNVLQAGHHLLSIINDILDLSKIENSAFRLDKEDNAIATMAAECVAMLEPKTRVKSQHVSLDIDEEIPPFAFDRLRIKQVVLNLLSNASKFTPEGGTIFVSVQSKSGAALIEVADNGVGMTPEHLKVALTPFGRVESAYNRTIDGTGLGLPIAKALVEAHGGTFEIASQYGLGTRVSFSLPVTHGTDLSGTHNLQRKMVQ